MQLGADCSAAVLPTMNQLQPLEAENITDPTNLFSSSPMGSSYYINPYFMNANFPYLDSTGFQDGLPDMSLQNQKQLPELMVGDLDYFTTSPASGTTNLNHHLRDGNLSSLNTGFQDGEMNIEVGNAKDDNISFDYTEFLEMMKDGDAEVQMDGKFSFPNTDCQDGGEINNRNSEAKIASEPARSGCHYSDTIQPEPALSDVEQNYEEEQQASGKKRRYRHTDEQIEKLEAALKTCPNPNDNKRAKLSKELGLTPSQVKFWFQNRRTQMRVKKGRSENETLKTENDNLRNENERLKEGKSQLLTTIRKMEYANARMSYEGQQLRRENTRLKQELCMRFGNKPF